MANEKNILLGYSGHAYVVADAAIVAGIRLDYYAEKNEVSENPYDLEYIGHEADKDFKAWNRGYQFVLGLGKNKIRANVAKLILQKGEKLLTVIHPQATVSDTVEIGQGTFIAAGAAVNPFAEIGDYVILNTSCVVEHECIISDGAHIAPGAVLAGNVTVGQRSFIGANAVIKEGISIGDDVKVGAGATILKDISNGKKVVGNPGKEI